MFLSQFLSKNAHSTDNNSKKSLMKVLYARPVNKSQYLKVELCVVRKNIITVVEMKTKQYYVRQHSTTKVRESQKDLTLKVALRLSHRCLRRSPLKAENIFPYGVKNNSRSHSTECCYRNRIIKQMYMKNRSYI